MRVIVFFDLPSVTNEEKKEYRKFVKFLKDEGFLMMQESVYCKLVLNYPTSELEVNKVKKNKTKEGTIQCLIITEKQYVEIQYILGKKTSSQIDSIDRIVEI